MRDVSLGWLTLFFFKHGHNKVPTLSLVIVRLLFGQEQSRSNRLVFLDGQDEVLVGLWVNGAFDGQAPLLVFIVFRLFCVLTDGSTGSDGSCFFFKMLAHGRPVISAHTSTNIEYHLRGFIDQVAIFRLPKLTGVIGRVQLGSLHFGRDRTGF